MFKGFGFMRILILFAAFFLIAAQGVKAEDAEYTADSYNAYDSGENCFYLEMDDTTTYKYKGKVYKDHDSEDDTVCMYGNGTFSMSSGIYGTWKATGSGAKLALNTKPLVKLYKKGFKAKKVTIKTAYVLVNIYDDDTVTGTYLIKGTATLKNNISVPFVTKGQFDGYRLDDDSY